MQNFVDKLFGIQAQTMNLRAQRAELLAANLANADTPNYKAKDIDFSSALNRATESELDKPMDQKCTAVTCGVGNPKAVLATVKQQNIDPVNTFIFSDHYDWETEDVEKMTSKMREKGIRHLLMTEKDGVKLIRFKKHFLELGIQLWVCKMKIEVNRAWDDLILQLQKHLAEGKS